MNQNIKNRRSIVYFSMEIGIDEKICSYSGGLGILAGDTIRSAADLRMPMVSVTLLYRKGNFRQRLEADGWQREEPTSWDFEKLPEEECLPEPRFKSKSGPFTFGPGANMSRARAATRSPPIFWTRTFTKTRSGTGD